jgi:hypothetical protein
MEWCIVSGSLCHTHPNNTIETHANGDICVRMEVDVVSRPGGPPNGCVFVLFRLSRVPVWMGTACTNMGGWTRVDRSILVCKKRRGVFGIRKEKKQKYLSLKKVIVGDSAPLWTAARSADWVGFPWVICSVLYCCALACISQNLVGGGGGGPNSLLSLLTAVSGLRGW